MEDRLERETQIAEPEAPAKDTALSESESSGQQAIAEEVGVTAMSPEVIQLIEQLMAGTEPYSRNLKPWEVPKFNPLHINICTLRAAGFKGVEISKILGLDQSRVSQIITHPYGVKLIRALVPKNSVRVLDIRTRLEEYAGDLLDKVYGQAMLSEDLEQVGKVTFSMLDRAGHAPKMQPADSKPSGVMSDSVLRRLTGALEQSQQVNTEVMPTWVPRKPPEEGALPVGEVLGSSPLRLAAGQAEGDEPAPGPLSAAGGQR
jgi:hypothetical protein